VRGGGSCKQRGLAAAGNSWQLSWCVSGLGVSQLVSVLGVCSVPAAVVTGHTC
jgi:hypothetical protein